MKQKPLFNVPDEMVYFDISIIFLDGFWSSILYRWPEIIHSLYKQWQNILNSAKSCSSSKSLDQMPDFFMCVCVCVCGYNST